MRSPHGAATGVAVAAALAALAGCASPNGADDRLQVYAASSLTEAFRDLAVAYEEAEPGIEGVALTFSGSQVLRLQIEQGARADVFASANPEHVEALAAAGLVDESRVFAANELVVITPLDDPAGIAHFEDLPRARRLVIGTDQVPVGAYTRYALRRADALHGPAFSDSVLARVVSEESNVRLTRAKVELGEADAAIVYRTDAQASERVRRVPIPPEANVRAEYHIGLLSEAPHPEAARSFVAFVLSDRGRTILSRYGFVVDAPRP